MKRLKGSVIDKFCLFWKKIVKIKFMFSRNTYEFAQGIPGTNSKTTHPIFFKKDIFFVTSKKKLHIGFFVS